MRLEVWDPLYEVHPTRLALLTLVERLCQVTSDLAVFCKDERCSLSSNCFCEHTFGLIEWATLARAANLSPYSELQRLWRPLSYCSLTACWDRVLSKCNLYASNLIATSPLEFGHQTLVTHTQVELLVQVVSLYELILVDELKIISPHVQSALFDAEHGRFCLNPHPDSAYFTVYGKHTGSIDLPGFTIWSVHSVCI